LHARIIDLLCFNCFTLVSGAGPDSLAGKGPALYRIVCFVAFCMATVSCIADLGLEIVFYVGWSCRCLPLGLDLILRAGGWIGR
jgi:hypothetical protein